MKIKTFNWEGYTNGRKEYKFSDLTNQELINWAENFGFKIIKGKNGVFVEGRIYKTRIKVR